MNFYMCAVVLLGFLGNFNYGFNTSAVNAPQMVIQEFIIECFIERFGTHLTTKSVTTYFSIVVTIYLVGGMVGVLCASWIAEKSGRKMGLIYPQMISTIAALLMGYCKDYYSYEMLVAGRFLVGVGDGLATGILPLYISEIAPIHIRGLLGTCNQLGATSGMLTSMVLGINGILGGVNTWPVLLSLVSVPCLIQFLLLLLLPESPRYLILSKCKIDHAEDALRKLRNLDNVYPEILSIQQEELTCNNETKYSVWQLLRASELRLSLMVAICLHFSQQMSGIFGIFAYSTSFFLSAGIDESISQYSTIAVGVILVLMSFVVMQLMDRAGRRNLILISYAGIIMCSTGITVTLFHMANENSGIVLVSFLLLFVVFYASGGAAVPWIAVSELFTQGPRAAAVSIGVFVNWLMHMVVSLVFPQLSSGPIEYSFLPWLISTALCFVFLYLYFPETKNTSTNDIADLFKVPNPWFTAVGLKKANEKKLLNLQNNADYGSKGTVPRIVTTSH